PSRSLAGLPTRYPDVDLVVIRENTEDLYQGIEFEKGTPEALELREELLRLSGRELREDSGFTVKPISVTGARRIVRFALEFVGAHGRRKVTLGHKANIMRFSDGLFLSIGQMEAEGLPEVWFEDTEIDQLSMRLVREPAEFDVLLLPNLYGDIISDLCAGLGGGLGLAAGANLGWEYAVFEPVHGSAPDIAGRGVANPIAMILSGAMLLRHLSEADAAPRARPTWAAPPRRRRSRGRSRSRCADERSRRSPKDRRLRRARGARVVRSLRGHRLGRHGRARGARGVPRDQRVARGALAGHAVGAVAGRPRGRPDRRPRGGPVPSVAPRDRMPAGHGREAGVRADRLAARRALPPGQDHRGRDRPRGHPDGRGFVRLRPRGPAHGARVGPHAVPTGWLARGPVGGRRAGRVRPCLPRGPRAARRARRFRSRTRGGGHRERHRGTGPADEAGEDVVSSGACGVRSPDRAPWEGVVSSRVRRDGRSTARARTSHAGGCGRRAEAWASRGGAHRP